MSKDSIKMSRKIAITAIFTALATVLMYLEFNIPFLPLVKFDFSELPILIGSYALGPVYGIIMELLKNLLHLPATGTAGIGELSNFLVGSIYVFTASKVYEKHRTKKGAVTSLIIAALTLGVIAIPLNLFLTLPLYRIVMGFTTEQIVGMCSAVNPLIKDKATLILWVFVPINLIKGVVIGFISFWVYKPISKIINSTYKKTR